MVMLSSIDISSELFKRRYQINHILVSSLVETESMNVYWGSIDIWRIY